MTSQRAETAMRHSSHSYISSAVALAVPLFVAGCLIAQVLPLDRSSGDDWRRTVNGWQAAFQHVANGRCHLIKDDALNDHVLWRQACVAWLDEGPVRYASATLALARWS